MSTESPHEHLRLAGITRLSLASPRGPTDAYLFDPHRLALPSWALALRGRSPALLITLDRHFDLVAPKDPQKVPASTAPLRELDEYTRWELDVRNVDHILAAMEAGLLGDAIVIARARPAGCVTGTTYVDRRGGEHTLLMVPTVDRVADGFGTREASIDAQDAAELLERHPDVVLDLDLDCFTTTSDADPTDILPWPAATIRSFLLPTGSEPFWDAVLAKTRALTIAREPHHIGGVLAAHALFDQMAPIVFGELLRVDVP